MACIGYARVSSRDQDHSTQEARLRAAGCEIVRAEKASGKSRDGHSELASILEFIRPGDELVVVKLDRLGRSTRDVLNLVHELDQKGAGLRVLEPEFCTSGTAGRLMATVLGMVAEMERQFILERQRAGIEAAKAKGGVYKGRKPSLPVEEVRRLPGEGKGPMEIAEVLGVSRMSVWRALNGSLPGQRDTGKWRHIWAASDATARNPCCRRPMANPGRHFGVSRSPRADDHAH